MMNLNSLFKKNNSPSLVTHREVCYATAVLAKYKPDGWKDDLSSPQLSLLKQQVCEKLNGWAVFNEKNKELCELLTQMERKVSQNGYISIDEMIEKLCKDYQEEISVAQENKQQLEVMGECLARASQDSEAAEIQQKLNKVNERWQHLLDLTAARVKKLRETMVVVQQLDKNMSSLRSWLAHIEMELASNCEQETIQQKLNQQQLAKLDGSDNDNEDMVKDVEDPTELQWDSSSLPQMSSHPAAGEPAQLEVRFRQLGQALDQALDAGRYHLQPREAAASSSNPDAESAFMSYELSTELLQSQDSDQTEAQDSECLEAQENVHMITDRQRLFLTEVSSDLEDLKERLEAVDKQQSHGKSSHAHPGHHESIPHHSWRQPCTSQLHGFHKWWRNRGGCGDGGRRWRCGWQRKWRKKSSWSRSLGATGSISSLSDFPDHVSSSTSSSSSTKGPSFLLCVLMFTLLFLLLLLVLVALTFSTNEDYSCYCYSFARSFHPVVF